MKYSHNSLFYEENGYVILDNLLSVKECDYIKRRLELHTTDDYNNILNPDRYEFLISQSVNKIKGSMRERIDYLKECIDEDLLILREIEILKKKYDFTNYLEKSKATKSLLSKGYKYETIKQHLKG